MLVICKQIPNKMSNFPPIEPPIEPAVTWNAHVISDSDLYGKFPRTSMPKRFPRAPSQKNVWTLVYDNIGNPLSSTSFGVFGLGLRILSTKHMDMVSVT